MVRDFNLTSAFYSHMSEDNKQNEPDTHAHVGNLEHNLMYECILKQNDSDIQEEIDGHSNQ